MMLRSSMTTLALAACLALPACSLAQGMGNMSMPSGSMHSGGMVAPAQVFDKILSGEEGEFVGVAEAMPADKFNFAPSSSMGKYDGVRTFAAEIKHVTEANYNFFRGWNIPGAKTRGEIEGLKSRDEILAALKESFQYEHAAFATITLQNAFVNMDGKGSTRVGTAAYALTHTNDHYGQMVEYLRMNGEIPPASRR